MFVGVELFRLGLVATPGVSWGGDQVLLKLSGVRVQVAKLVTTPGGNQVLWKLQDIVGQVSGLVT